MKKDYWIVLYFLIVFMIINLLALFGSRVDALTLSPYSAVNVHQIEFYSNATTYGSDELFWYPCDYDFMFDSFYNKNSLPITSNNVAISTSKLNIDFSLSQPLSGDRSYLITFIVFDYAGRNNLYSLKPISSIGEFYWSDYSTSKLMNPLNSICQDFTISYFTFYVENAQAGVLSLTFNKSLNFVARGLGASSQVIISDVTTYSNDPTSVDNALLEQSKQQTQAIKDLTETQKDTNQKLDDLTEEQKKQNDYLMDETAPDSDISSLGTVQGLLPPGPVDSLLNIPFMFLSVIVSSLGSKCTPITGTWVFNTSITFSCFDDVLYSKIPDSLMIFINIIPSAFILITYFKYLYMKVDRAVNMDTNADDEWGVV